jgi:hypothetical protein
VPQDRPTDIEVPVQAMAKSNPNLRDEFTKLQRYPTRKAMAFLQLVTD